MKVFQKIVKSIYGPEYYQELLTKPFSYSLKYFFLFILLVAVVATALLSWVAIPKVVLFANVAGAKVIGYYPEELTVTVANGQVSVNVPEPYVVAMPEEFRNNEKFKINNMPAEDFTNLLIINTKENFTIDQFIAADTAFLLTKDSIVGYEKNKQITIRPLDKQLNFKLNKPTVEMYVGKIKPFLPFVYPIVVVGISLLSVAVLAFKLLYLLIGALIIWLVMKIKKVPTGYGKAYQIGLHAMTLGILVGTAITVTRFFMHIPDIPFLFTVLLIIAVAVNIKKPEPVVTVPTV